MDRNVVEFMQSAKEHGLAPEQLAHISIAMSMKRIADAVSGGQAATLLADISKSLSDIARVKELGL